MSACREAVIGDYVLNEMGEVFSYRKGFPYRMSTHDNGSGYIVTTLYGVKRYLHRILAQAFIPNPDNLPHINHIDGNPHNNSLDNLEWCTAKHNIQHAYDTGLNPGRAGTPVIATCIKTGVETRYKTQAAAEEDGFNNAHICSCLKGRMKTHRNHLWRYDYD